MMSRRDTTLRAMKQYADLPEAEPGESFRDYWKRVARQWLVTRPDADPALRRRVEVILRRDAVRRARWPRRGAHPVPRLPSEWTRRSISLVGDLKRVEQIASSWESDAGWIVRAIEPTEPVDGHPSATVHVDVHRAKPAGADADLSDSDPPSPA